MNRPLCIINSCLFDYNFCFTIFYTSWCCWSHAASLHLFPVYRVDFLMGTTVDHVCIMCIETVTCILHRQPEDRDGAQWRPSRRSRNKYTLWNVQLPSNKGNQIKYILQHSSVVSTDCAVTIVPLIKISCSYTRRKVSVTCV